MSAEIVRLDEGQARRLTERIRLTAHSARESLTRLRDLVDEAQRAEVHVTLGYASWTAYLADVFGEEPMRLPRDQRQELVGYLAGEGMSTRAIAPIVGVSQPLTRRSPPSLPSHNPHLMQEARHPTTKPDRATSLPKEYSMKPKSLSGAARVAHERRILLDAARARLAERDESSVPDVMALLRAHQAVAR